MEKDAQRRVDEIRSRSSELENHLIDEYRSGGLSRREFVRNGTVAGMSLSTLGFLASACGASDEDGGDSGEPETGGENTAEVRPGGTIRAGIQAPASDLDPIKVNNQGALAVLGQSGEYLAFSDNELKLQPRIAESWEPNEDGSVWTFKIRQGVKYHDGKAMTAEDVAESINTHADPDNGSNALSVFAGVMSKGGAKATDESTVTVELDAPNGNFPYLLSSDNYNLIILPKGFDYPSWPKNFQGTGPWKMEKYTPDVGITYVKNPDYWDSSRMPNADKSEVKFYAKEQASVLGLQGDEVDLIAQYSATGGKALLTDPNVTTIELRSSVHRQVHMRTDKGPLADKRIRQAIGLLVDRNALVDGLLEGKADIGNDSPFAPVFPDTDKTVPQRQQDVEQAKQLLADAGAANISVTLTTWDGFELPQLAQLIQNDLKQGGINVKLNVTDAGTYYGDAVYGKSPWLDSEFGITEYGHRGVPNVFLNAPLRSDGTWNSAHFKNKEYDALAKEYTAALEPGAKKTAAKKIQELLLDETPILFPYVYFYQPGTKKNVAGVEVSAMGHVDLTKTGFTA
jgi:peptide/nickel transport system substrate-binding protein